MRRWAHKLEILKLIKLHDATIFSRFWFLIFKSFNVKSKSDKRVKDTLMIVIIIICSIFIFLVVSVSISWRTYQFLLRWLPTLQISQYFYYGGWWTSLVLKFLTDFTIFPQFLLLWYVPKSYSGLVGYLQILENFIFCNRDNDFLLNLFLFNFQRNKKIFAAMDKAIAAYDGNFALAVLVGMCGCCGGGFINHAITCLTSKTVATIKHDTSL